MPAGVPAHRTMLETSRIVRRGAGKEAMAWGPRGGPAPQGRRLVTSEVHHTADRLALVHQVEGLVDVLQRHLMGDHRVDLDLPIHVPVDDLRDVGTPARAAEGST